MRADSGASSVKRIAEPAVLLRQGLRELGLDAALGEPLMAYLAELVKWNGAYNLTAVRDPADMVTRHLLDSLAVIQHASRLVPHAALWMDIGSGAGLPGIPLALVRPDWHVTLLDSNGKKTRFLRHAQRRLGLQNIEVVEARAEEHQAGVLADALISRAFASLADFLRLTAHLLKPGGRWLAMKGRVDDNELSQLHAGASVEQVMPLNVPGLAEQRHLVVCSRRPWSSPSQP
ncbi:MAG: 16S rRNA (guanine(527)-N(7))-methyltransferase RsmG [Panacagrimonas sp.]